MSSKGPPKDELYVSAEGIKRSAPWRLADYSREGPLTDEQVADLATRFDLDPSNVRRLSRALNVVLDRESSANWVPAHLLTAKARGRDQMRKALRDVVTAQVRLKAGLDRLKTLSLEDETSFVRMWGIHDALQDCQRLLRDVPATLEDIVKSPEGILVLEPTNKRKVADGRRDLVLMAIFHLWTRSGRTLTYTTDPDKSKRSGPLIDFVNAVVACVTDPPSGLRGHMVVKAIKLFDRRNEPGRASVRVSDADWDTWTEPLRSFSVEESPRAWSDPPPTSIRNPREDWITPVHTWERLAKRMRGARDGAPDRETDDGPTDPTEPAPRGGPGDADDQ